MLTKEAQVHTTLFSEGLVVEKTEDSVRLKRVKLLGYESKNGRRYLQPEASLYEGVKINLDHPEYFSNKSVRDTIGYAESVEVDETGVWGDVVLNPHHEATAQIVWVAENAPRTMGMSHVAYTDEVDTHEDEDGDEIPILKVLEVVSVDLVGSPATTNGIFEQKEDTQMKERIEALEAEVKALEASLATAQENLRQEQEAHEATKAAHEQEQKDAARVALLEEHGLGEAHEAFVKAVKEAESDEDALALIESVKPVENKPKSKAQGEAQKPDALGEAKDYEALKESGLFNYKGA